MRTYLDLINEGLTPAKLRHFLDNHAPLSAIAAQYGTDVPMVEFMMARWGFAHLSGRAKSNVILVREMQHG